MFRAGERLVEALGHDQADVPRALRVGITVRSRARPRVLDIIEPSHAGVHALDLDSSSADLARRAVEVLIAHVKAVQGTEK